MASSSPIASLHSHAPNTGASRYPDPASIPQPKKRQDNARVLSRRVTCVHIRSYRLLLKHGWNPIRLSPRIAWRVTKPFEAVRPRRAAPGRYSLLPARGHWSGPPEHRPMCAVLGPRHRARQSHISRRRATARRHFKTAVARGHGSDRARMPYGGPERVGESACVRDRDARARAPGRRASARASHRLLRWHDGLSTTADGLLRREGGQRRTIEVSRR